MPAPFIGDKQVDAGMLQFVLDDLYDRFDLRDAEAPLGYLETYEVNSGAGVSLPATTWVQMPLGTLTRKRGTSLKTSGNTIVVPFDGYYHVDIQCGTNAASTAARFLTRIKRDATVDGANSIARDERYVNATFTDIHLTYVGYLLANDPVNVQMWNSAASFASYNVERFFVGYLGK